MSLKHSYTVLAPIYDVIVSQTTAAMRRNSLARLGHIQNQNILLCGIGTGLDIPALPVGADYIGMDMTAAMLQRARIRSQQRHDIHLHRGDVMRMPYTDQQFDTIIMHLILAVVAEPQRALQEATRVLKPGGRILILDKFLRRGQTAWLRRALNLFLRHVATRTDVVLEPLLEQCPDLHVVQMTPLRPGNWFHEIELRKKE